MTGGGQETQNRTWPRVLAVVVNWNGRQDLRRCVLSLLASDYPADRLSIGVVDNASTDGSIEDVADCGPSVRFLRSATNLEYVRAANWGIREWLDDSVKYVWILNNDIVVNPATLRTLVATAEKNPDAGILSPLIVEMGRTGPCAHAGYRIHFPTGILSSIYRTPPGEPEGESGACEVDSMMGCALLVKTEVIRRLGPLPEIYRAYFEEVEYQVRARRAGFKILCVHGARVGHRRAASYDRKILRRAYLLLRNLLLFQCRNARPWELAVFLPYYALIHLPWFLARGCAYAIMARRRQK